MRCVRRFPQERLLAMKSVTLKDVAAAAGVSVSTVSRVLDERLHRNRPLPSGFDKSPPSSVTDATRPPPHCVEEIPARWVFWFLA